MELQYLDLNYLIDRAYNILKKEQKNKKNFTKPIIVNHNRKSYITNFINFCESINRLPEDVRKFISKDINVDTSFVTENNLEDNNNSGLKLNNYYKSAQIMNTITNYMKQYVLCDSCKSGNTEIEKIERINYIICGTCKSKKAIC